MYSIYDTHNVLVRKNYPTYQAAFTQLIVWGRYDLIIKKTMKRTL